MSKEIENHTKHGWEKIIKSYYNECVQAAEEAEQAHDADKRSVHKREVYQYCFAQVEAIEELMDKLDIDYEDEEEDI